MFNAGHEAIMFKLPERLPEGKWERLVDTAEPQLDQHHLLRLSSYRVRARSTVVLCLRRKKIAGTPSSGGFSG
jgi:hypothetical protein